MRQAIAERTEAGRCLAVRSLIAALALALVLLVPALHAQDDIHHDAWVSVDQAARRGLNEASGTELDYSTSHGGRHAEYGGWVYEARGGGYGYTTPITSGNLDTIRQSTRDLAEPSAETDAGTSEPTLITGERVVAFYHIHPPHPDYDSEHFSIEDLHFAENHGVPIYVRTPRGEYRKYDPAKHEPETYDPDHDDDSVEPYKGDDEARVAKASGEPHLDTHDGSFTNFQAAGEFLAVRTDGGDLTIMLRLEPYLNLDSVSVVTGVAVAFGGARVGVYAQPPYVLVNGKVIDPDDVDGMIIPGGTTLAKDGDDVTIRTPAGDRILARNRFHERLDTEYLLAEDRQGSVSGLLGDFDGTSGNDFVTRSGEPVDVGTPEIPNYHGLYEVWGPSWRIGDSESIFDYVHGKTAAEYQIVDFPRSRMSYADLERDASFDAASARCRDIGVAQPTALKRCVFDVVVTGDNRFAETYRDEMALGYASAVASARGVTISGKIAVPGAVTRQRVVVREAGQRLFLAQESFAAALDLVNVGLFDRDGRAVIAKCFGCGDVGLFTVSAPGVYYLRAGTPRDTETGEFAVKLWYVPPPDEFQIDTNASIGPGQPGPGAGQIERPGAADEYTFRLDGPAEIGVHVLQFDAALDLVNWQIIDSNGDRAAGKCLGCGGEERVSLERAGVYRLRVGTIDREAGTGNYRLALSITE